MRWQDHVLPVWRCGLAAAALLLAQSVAELAHAQFAQQGAKIVAPVAPDPDAAIGLSRFGSSIAVSQDGNTAVIGGPKDGALAHDDEGVGAAWIYVRDNAGNWTKQAKLVGSTTSSGQNQGYSVAISADGNIAVVGGPARDDPIMQVPPFSANNAAWVFRRSNGTTWDSGYKITIFRPQSMHLGEAVAISGDGSTIAIADPMDADGSSNFTGAVFIFIDDGMGHWTFQDYLIASDAIGNATQGSSVALSGDGNTVLIGGYSDDYDPNPDNSGPIGAAWVWTRSGTTWTKQQKLVGTGYSEPPYQGYSVALTDDGNTAIIGGPQDGSGAVWSFTRSGATWTQQARMVGTGSIGYANQGLAVAASNDGNTLASGGYFDNSGQGATWIFNRSAGAWAQQGNKLLGSGGIDDGVYGISQGAAVALSADGNTLLVGGPDDDSEKGAAWVFTQKPVVASVTPNRGGTAGGSSVVIRGTGFNGATKVKFGDAEVTCPGVTPACTIVDPTRINVTTPAHAAADNVAVVVTGVFGDSNSDITYTFSDVPPPPDITSISPIRGKATGGTSVTINGTLFSNASAVKFGSANAASFAVDSATKITAVTPAHAAGAVSVSVTTPGGTDSLSNAFTFFTVPAITQLGPKQDYIFGGAQVIIIGTNLTNVTAVKFGRTSATFNVDANTQITATAPAHAAGTVDVVVTDPNGSSANTAADDFFYVGFPPATALYKFKGGAKDVANPVGWLIADTAGNLYGVARTGAAGFGGVFMLSPPAPPKTAWTRTILHSFDGINGADPVSGLIADAQGNLYGTTTNNGGTAQAGLVYRLKRPVADARAKAAWTYEVLYTFKDGADGGTPTGGVVLDGSGNVYGITRDSKKLGYGVIYKLTPKATAPWTKTTLYTLPGAPGPLFAESRLVMDDGVIWGTSSQGGKFGNGTVFKYTPPAGGKLPKPVTVYSFKTSGDGMTPGYGGLAIDSKGNVFGTTSQGGSAGGGLVFRLAAANSAESIVYDFGFDDLAGETPFYGVALAGKTLVGATYQGSNGNGGAVFKLTAPGGPGPWKSTPLHVFNSNDPLGHNPRADLLVVKNVIYGFTEQGGGGACNCGAVFMIQP